MSKGLYRIVNTYNNQEMSIYPSEDVEKSIEDFENGIMPGRLFERYKYKESLKAELLEKTDSLAERYAFYTWPKLSRLSYSDECMSKSLDPKFSKTVKNSVDWLVETFQDPKYTFEMIVVDDVLTATTRWGLFYEDNNGDKKALTEDFRPVVFNTEAEAKAKLKAIETDPIKNYVLTTIHGQDLPHFAGFCHLARFSVK